MKILIFTEGTIIMHLSGKNVSRKERVKQSEEHGPSVCQFRNYIPIDNAVEKLNNWKNEGAQIYYLTSRTTSKQIEDIKFVLNKYDFPDRKNLLFRHKKFLFTNENYKDIAQKLMPNIIIEDDCESIGGKPEMTFSNISPEIKKNIKSIPIKEFGGIDHLPNKLKELINL